MELVERQLQPSTARTSLVRCRSYDPYEIRQAIRRGLELAGNPQSFIRAGDRILLKPNMLSAKEPEYAATTHPEVVVAVGEVILDCGGKIVFGDSPAGASKDITKYWHITGFAEAAKHLGVQPVSFESGGIKSFSAPGGFVNISRIALEVDGIVNLPKLKTHQLTGMTGAVKNMFGTVPGFRKGYLHGLAPEPLPFCRFVVAVYREVIPQLNIMDAVLAMEGNGPSSGQPRKVDALLFSRDALRMDALAAQLICMEPRSLPVFQAAFEAGLWDWNYEETETIGDAVQDLIVPDFKHPDVSRLERIPPFVKRNLKKLIWIRPRSNPELCTACNLCVDSCPEEAMSMKKDHPVIDYQKCIKCGCCDEVCPENAIDQQISLLAKLLS